MLNVNMVSVVMLNVVMLSVVSPYSPVNELDGAWLDFLPEDHEQPGGKLESLLRARVGALP